MNEVSRRLVEIERYEQAAEFLEGIDAHKATRARARTQGGGRERETERQRDRERERVCVCS